MSSSYFRTFLRALSSAAFPACFVLNLILLGAKVSVHVASQIRVLPFVYGINVMPSTLFPSVRANPIGSRTAGTSADTSARFMMLFNSEWVAYLPALLRHFKPWWPFLSTCDPHRYQFPTAIPWWSEKRCFLTMYQSILMVMRVAMLRIQVFVSPRTLLCRNFPTPPKFMGSEAKVQVSFSNCAFVNCSSVDFIRLSNSANVYPGGSTPVLCAIGRCPKKSEFVHNTNAGWQLVKFVHFRAKEEFALRWIYV